MSDYLRPSAPYPIDERLSALAIAYDRAESDAAQGDVHPGLTRSREMSRERELKAIVAGYAESLRGRLALQSLARATRHRLAEQCVTSWSRRVQAPVVAACRARGASPRAATAIALAFAAEMIKVQPNQTLHGSTR